MEKQADPGSYIQHGVRGGVRRFALAAKDICDQLISYKINSTNLSNWLTDSTIHQRHKRRLVRSQQEPVQQSFLHFLSPVRLPRSCSRLTSVFSAFHPQQCGQQRPIYGSFARYIQCNLIHCQEPVKKFNGGIERKELAIPKEIRKALGSGRLGRGA